MSGALETMTADETAQMQQMAEADGQPWPEGEKAQQQPEAQPQATESPAADGQQQPQQQKTVPLEALQAERNTAKELRRQLADVERNNAANMARLQERLDLLAQAAQAVPQQQIQQAAPAQEAPPPDAQTDPMGFVQWHLNQQRRETEALRTQLAEVKQFADTGRQNQHQQMQMQALINWGQQDENQFAATQPDYAQAAAFLREGRAREYAALGYAPQQITNAIASESIRIAQEAQRAGTSFGRSIYNLAVARGYKAAEAADPAPATGPQAAVERAVKGAAMAPGLPNGGAPRGEPSAQALANMSEAQFAEYYAKVQKNPAAMRAMFGE